jgi:thiol-disulfide isomerase/thioredoxin
MNIIKGIRKSFTHILGLLILVGCNQFQKTPFEELKQIGTDLKKIETKEYSYLIKSYSSYSGDTTKRSGIIFFEDNPKDTAIGLNFSNKSELSESFYNGEYIITLLKSDSAALKKPLCDFNNGHMTVYPYLELSLGAIQNFLTDTLLSVQIDSLIKTDTIFNNNKCYSYSFWADNVLIDTHKMMKKGRKKINLIVRKEDNIPLLYSQYAPIQRETKFDFYYNEAQFTNFIPNKKNNNISFSIESIPEYYKWDKLTSINYLLPLNIKAPNWKLPLITGDSLSLNSLRGKYVLLDFWFIGCGSCVQSIPTLNEIQQKYTEEKLNVIGVNCFSNQKEKIKEYCNSNNMNYINVWNGDLIAENYNVNAAPIFYLIDKEGNIVYRQLGHDETTLKENIEKIMTNTHPYKVQL